MKVDSEKIKRELGKVNVFIDDVYDLVNSKEAYPEAIPVLLSLLNGEFEKINIKEGLVRALTTKEAKGEGSALLNVYNNTPKEFQSFRWAIGNALNTIIIEDDLDEVLKIIKDKNNGISRQMFVMALGKIKSKTIENTLIELLDDEDVKLQALSSLSKLKSTKSREKIKSLLEDSKGVFKRELQKVLNKMA